MGNRSKSRTFELQSDIGDVIDFVINYVETEDREIVYGGSEPSLDVRVETKHKYKITIHQLKDKITN